MWSTDTVGFVDDGTGAVCAVQVRPIPPGETSEVPADLVLIAKGFTGAEQPVIDAFASFDNVYVAGDARMGSTLVVTAIADALDIANRIDTALRN